MKKIIFSLILVALTVFKIQAQGGGVDYSFQPPSTTDGEVDAIVVQPDGKILLAGTFKKYGTATVNRIVRITKEGTRDGSFNPGAGAGSVVQSMALQPDGKILIGGLFTTYDGIARNKIARLNSDGTLDASFNTGTGTATFVQSIEVQPDGKILVGGLFMQLGGTTVNNIARLNADGSIDASFNMGTGTDDYIADIELQSDGKILISGYFTEYNGTPINSIARLNADGTLDTSFDPGSGANEYVGVIKVLDDDKILIAGEFTTYNGTAVSRIARIESDGSLDATFNPGSGPDYFISSIAVQADHKIVVAGFFTSFNGVAKNRLARLNADGSQDLNFNIGTGANDGITTCALQADSAILIGGPFTTYNGQPRKSVARVHDGCGLVFKANQVSICQGESYVFNNHTYTSTNTYLDTLQTALGCDSIVITILTVKASGTFNNPQIICGSGSYTVGAHTYTATGTYRDTLQNSLGCDSIVVTQLTKIPNTLNNPQTICDGEEYMFMNSIYTVAGTYNDVVEVAGCNVTVSTVLTVNPLPFSTLSKTICSGGSYTYNGHVYTLAGVYRDTIRRMQGGCDSIVVTTLAVSSIPFSNVSKTICPGGSYTYNGHVYTLAGVYRDTVDNAQGCDSIVVTTLTIDQPDVSVTQTGSTLSANATGVAYQWLDAGDEYAEIADATGQSYTPLTGGNYAVEITLNNCVDTSAAYEIMLTGIKASAFQKSIQFAPNPVEEYLELTSNTGTNIISVRILTASGQFIHATSSTRVDVSALSKGLYLLEVETNQGVWRERFVK